MMLAQLAPEADDDHELEQPELGVRVARKADGELVEAARLAGRELPEFPLAVALAPGRRAAAERDDAGGPERVELAVVEAHTAQELIELQHADSGRGSVSGRRQAERAEPLRRGRRLGG